MRSTIKLAFQVFLGALIWLLLSQFDKFILSSTLGLDEYGIFFLCVQVSTVITMISSPFSIALLPKLSRHVHVGDKKAYVDLYLKSFQFILSILAPVCFYRFL